MPPGNFWFQLASPRMGVTLKNETTGQLQTHEINRKSTDLLQQHEGTPPVSCSPKDTSKRMLELFPPPWVVSYIDWNALKSSPANIAKLPMQLRLQWSNAERVGLGASTKNYLLVLWQGLLSFRATCYKDICILLGSQLGLPCICMNL